VALQDDPTWTSTGDRIVDNAGDGVKLGSGGGSAARVIMSGGEVTGNGAGGAGHGFNLSCVVSGDVCLKLTGSTVLANKQVGVRLGGSSTANLGDAATPGNNVFNPPAGSQLAKNGQAAICNQSSQDIQARTNHFSRCAPASATGTGCGAAVDVVQVRAGAVVTTGCVTP
jgi:hypothetical protein